MIKSDKERADKMRMALMNEAVQLRFQHSTEVAASLTDLVANSSDETMLTFARVIEEIDHMAGGDEAKFTRIIGTLKKSL
tara:strand:- start:491 stop:730 length:240 start_codon:yes stop_codon:yes gene_type:complete